MRLYRTIEVIIISFSLTEENRLKIEDFLKQCYALLRTNDYKIEVRDKNEDFDDQYPMTDQEKRSVLLSLTVDDCVAIEPNTNPRFSDAEIFFFKKDKMLIVYGEEELVKLYIKMYTQTFPAYDRICVISFHKDGVYD